jgi:hypothetical protein
MSTIIERLRDEAIPAEEVQALREEAAVELERLELRQVTEEEQQLIAQAKVFFHAGAQHESAEKLQALLERVK